MTGEGHAHCSISPYIWYAEIGGRDNRLCGIFNTFSRRVAGIIIAELSHKVPPREVMRMEAMDAGASLIAGRYEIITPIASGGMAMVYRGWDHFIGRYVAIKVLRPPENPSADPHGIERFRREAQAAAKIAHPNVVTVYDFLDDGHDQFLIMEFVDGINLKRLITQRGPLPVVRALHITEQMCAALAAAHARGLIHRDIKPQNILLTSDGRARLTDFGIVRMQDSDALTRSGIVLGTADYLSPEQARGDRLGPQSDLYSLGVVCFEMLTGTPPFTGEKPVEIAMRHATEAIPPLTSRNPQLPRDLEALVRRAVEHDPKKRYRSAVIMGRAISAYRQKLLHPASFVSAALPAESIGIVRPVASRSRRKRGGPLEWLTHMFGFTL
jgi:serine/threonine protein kinase